MFRKSCGICLCGFFLSRKKLILGAFFLKQLSETNKLFAVWIRCLYKLQQRLLLLRFAFNRMVLCLSNVYSDTSWPSKDIKLHQSQPQLVKMCCPFDKWSSFVQDFGVLQQEFRINFCLSLLFWCVLWLNDKYKATHADNSPIIAY